MFVLFITFVTCLANLLLCGSNGIVRSDQIRSVAQSCPTLCDPLNHSTPGLPVHHQLLEFTETQVHRVGDAIQLNSGGLLSPAPGKYFAAHKELNLNQWRFVHHEIIGIKSGQGTLWRYSLEHVYTYILIKHKQYFLVTIILFLRIEISYRSPSFQLPSNSPGFLPIWHYNSVTLDFILFF